MFNSISIAEVTYTQKETADCYEWWLVKSQKVGSTVLWRIIRHSPEKNKAKTIQEPLWDSNQVSHKKSLQRYPSASLLDDFRY
jgi:hypothetical protein